MSNDASLDINQESNPVQTVAPTKEDNNMTNGFLVVSGTHGVVRILVG